MGAINTLPQIKRLVATVIHSLPDLFNLVIFMLFIFILFGIVGLQQFQGLEFNRCRTTPAPVNGVWPLDTSVSTLCTLNKAGSCPAGSTCGNPLTYSLTPHETDAQAEMLGGGLVNFDNIGQSVLSIFQCLTLVGWSQMMYNYQDAGNTIFAPIYFCFLVFFGSYFLLNLFLAVINESFDSIAEKEKKKEEEEMLSREQALQRKKDALKSIFRMIRLNDKRQDFMFAAGVKVKIRFWDLVFEAIKRHKYKLDKNQVMQGDNGIFRQSVEKDVKKSKRRQSVMRNSFNIQRTMEKILDESHGEVNADGVPGARKPKVKKSITNTGIEMAMHFQQTELAQQKLVGVDASNSSLSLCSSLVQSNDGGDLRLNLATDGLDDGKSKQEILQEEVKETLQSERDRQRSWSAQQKRRKSKVGDMWNVGGTNEKGISEGGFRSGDKIHLSATPKSSRPPSQKGVDPKEAFAKQPMTMLKLDVDFKRKDSIVPPREQSIFGQ